MWSTPTARHCLTLARRHHHRVNNRGSGSAGVGDRGLGRGFIRIYCIPDTGVANEFILVVQTLTPSLDTEPKKKKGKENLHRSQMFACAGVLK